MSLETNDALLQQLWDGFNERNLDIIFELASPDYVDYAVPPGMPATREGWKMLNTGFIAAFPDSQVQKLDIISAENHVIGRFKLTGTHQGELMGIPATNQSIDVSAIMILHIQNGKFIERWEEFDTMTMMQQLNVTGN